MKPVSVPWAATLIALIMSLPVAQAQLALERSAGEIVVTSEAPPTWKIVFAVGSQADKQNPGGGIVRALHIPASNQKSIVGTDPSQFGYAGLGLDNLEWRYIKDGKGVRAPIGTDATIDALEVTRDTSDEIVIRITGRWKNIPRFTRTITISPFGFHTRLEADWDGPTEYRGMWWLTSLFRSSWVDNGRVAIRDEDTAPQILPVARGSVFALPEGISFPYEVSFPLRQGPRRELILRVASFGTDQPPGLRYELWPEERGFVMFYPRWIGRPFERRRYVFDYAWTFGEVNGHERAPTPPIPSSGMALAAAVAVAAQEQPNILLIVPDQMRGSAFGAAGNPDVRTPHIDSLAREGMMFRNTYANVPVCGPARAILLTGTYPHVNGMVANDLRLRESQATISGILQGAGYRTGFVGKWHLDGGPRLPGFVPPGPRRHGFEFWAAYECHHRHFLPWYFRDTPEMILVSKFEPEASADFAIEFLKTQPAGKPFFLTVMMGPPHDPYGAPEEYMEQYDPAALTMRGNWKPGSETRPAKEGIPPELRRPGMPKASYVKTGGREEVAAYYAAITAIDDQVGRLLRTLKETNRDRDTIVLFTSDHGDMLGSHGLRRKRKPHQESAAVPGIMRWPGHIPAGRVVDTLFSHVDMAPTLLRLAGIEPPKEMQGADLSRVALGLTTKGPEEVLLQIFVPYAGDQVAAPWRGIVTERYTYARHESEPWVLFDNRSDPLQTDNLAADPRHARLRSELDDRLATFMSRSGDDWRFNSNERVEERSRLYAHETFYSIPEYLEWVKANPDKSR